MILELNSLIEESFYNRSLPKFIRWFRGKVLTTEIYKVNVITGNYVNFEYLQVIT